MSSSYSLDAKTSRGRARIFLRLNTDDLATHPHNRSTRYQIANLILLPSCLNFAARFSTRYLEKKRQVPTSGS